MTITEANAANRIANEVIKLAKAGVAVSPDLEHGIAGLLLNAEKALKAGHGPKSFFSSLRFARAAFQRSSAPEKKGFCKLCHGSGKVDRGNGSTRPCTCVAGLLESHRRKSPGAADPRKLLAQKELEASR
jgi:hypothetical protein